jgi:tetratricopeptide (TPR) repeat protein
MDSRRILTVFFLVISSAVTRVSLYADDYYDLSARGDSAAAGKYAEWAEALIARGRWDEALAGLERASDYADVSSDLSYLLALARSHENKSRGAVLESLRRAFEADRWHNYTAAEARLLEAEVLIVLRNFSGALASLSLADEKEQTMILSLLALKGLPDNNEFRRLLDLSLDRYPGSSRIAEILLDYAALKLPEGNEESLVSLVLGRLPFLLASDPHLVYKAVPFMRDTGEARRLLAAYRSVNRARPASIPACLNLGLIGEETAVSELFSPGPAAEDLVLDRSLLLKVFGLLRNQAGRELFTRNLLRYSGVIFDDNDGDGYPEASTRYKNGALLDFSFDADQDGLSDLYISFFPGTGPQWAYQVVVPGDSGGIFAFPVRDEDRTKMNIVWQPYPGVISAELGGSTYTLRPGDFRYSPVRFIELAGGSLTQGLLYPVMEDEYSRLTRRTLVSFSISIKRPSEEFPGGEERIDLENGIPRLAAVFLNGKTVSVTEYVLGRPSRQRLDLDLDGRMETVRRFSKGEYPAGNDEFVIDYKAKIELSESDWDGDGNFETGEEYLEDGRVIYSWDVDKDGVRDYSEVRNGK